MNNGFYMTQTHSQQWATVWMNEEDVLWHMCMIKKKNPIAILKKRGKRDKRTEEIKIINNSYFSTQENSSYFIG